MNRSLLLNFTRQDLIDRYSGSILGGAWSFILPLMNIMIFILVFSQIMGAKLALLGMEFSEYSYSIYLVSGMISWLAFSNSVVRITNVFKEKSGLIAKVNLDLTFLPLYILLTETVIFFISMAFFLLFLLFLDFPISWHWLLIPFLFIVQQLLAYTLGFIFAVLSVFIKDVRELVGVMMQLWFWSTPIVYVMQIIPEFAQKIIQLNPMFIIISAYRDIIMFHKTPDSDKLFILLIITITLLLLSIRLFKKLEKDVRDFI